MLEADCDLSFSRPPRTTEHKRAERRHAPKVKANDDDMTLDEDYHLPELATDVVTQPHAMITFDSFYKAYWPHFPSDCTKGLGKNSLE